MLLGIGLVFGGMQFLSSGPTDAPLVAVEDPDRDLGIISAGQEREVVFCVHNAGARALRVVGVEDSRRNGCCFRGKLAGPIAIPPRGSTQVGFVLSIHRPRAFSATLDLFVEDGGVRSIPLSVHGEAIVPPSSNSADHPASYGD